MSKFNKAQVDFLSKELGIAVDVKSEIELDSSTLFKIDDYCASLEMADAWKLSTEGGNRDARTEIAYSILCDISEEVLGRYIAQQ